MRGLADAIGKQPEVALAALSSVAHGSFFDIFHANPHKKPGSFDPGSICSLN